MTGVLIKRGKFRHKDKHTGTTPCENEGTDWNVFISEETPKIASKPPEARTEAWEGTNPAEKLISDV